MKPSQARTFIVDSAMAANKMQLIKPHRHYFFSSDDSSVMKQILATHVPDGREIDTRPLLDIVEDVFNRATLTSLSLALSQTTAAAVAEVENSTDKNIILTSTDTLEALAYIIHKISCEISRESGGESGGYSTAVSLFTMLANYSWDAKAVVIMAALAVNYGEFFLTAQLNTINPLATGIARLKHMPDLHKHSEVMKPRFDTIEMLIKTMLDVTKCVVEFKELPTDYIGAVDSPDFSMALAHIPTAVYWLVRSAAACASHFVGLIGMGYEYYISTSEIWELSSLSHKLTNILDHLRNLLALCRRHVDEKRHVEAYKLLVNLFETPQSDNIKPLKALFSSKDDHAYPLIDLSTKKKCGVDVLRRKIVLVLISDLNITVEELFVLVQIFMSDSAYQGGRFDRQFEVVWLPIVDPDVTWTSAMEESFDKLKLTMPWHAVRKPSLVDPAVVKYVRKVWNFGKRPLVVTVNADGKVVNPNAMHMAYIWGSIAFPFTSAREESLWNEETWRMELLVDEIDPLLVTWIREGKYVCLYGGDDVEWIRSFTTKIRDVARAAKIPLEMVYVGKSNPKKSVKKATDVISSENLSHCWQDPVMVWFFWSRLESMWYSKMQQGKRVEDDNIMREVMSLLSYDSGEKSWAMITRGSGGAIGEYVKAHGKEMAECLTDFDKWKPNVEIEGFLPALGNALKPFDPYEHCTKLVLPSGNSPWVRGSVMCSDCMRPMEKYVLYRCCHTPAGDTE